MADAFKSRQYRAICNLAKRYRTSVKQNAGSGLQKSFAGKILDESGQSNNGEFSRGKITIDG